MVKMEKEATWPASQEEAVMPIVCTRRMVRGASLGILLDFDRWDGL